MRHLKAVLGAVLAMALPAQADVLTVPISVTVSNGASFLIPPFDAGLGNVDSFQVSVTGSVTWASQQTTPVIDLAWSGVFVTSGQFIRGHYFDISAHHTPGVIPIDFSGQNSFPGEYLFGPSSEVSILRSVNLALEMPCSLCQSDTLTGSLEADVNFTYTPAANQVTAFLDALPVPAPRIGSGLLAFAAVLLALLVRSVRQFVI